MSIIWPESTVAKERVFIWRKIRLRFGNESGEFVRVIFFGSPSAGAFDRARRSLKRRDRVLMENVVGERISSEPIPSLNEIGRSRRFRDGSTFRLIRKTTISRPG